MTQSPPIISSLKISFIRPFTFPNFTENFDILNPELDFLSSSNSYAQYYRGLESSGKGPEYKLIPYEIPEVGPLTPLRKRHTLNSYWKSIRLLIKNQEKKGKICNNLFLLLPIKIQILRTSMRINIPELELLNEINLPANVYAYLFPFGSCVMNMDIDIPEIYCSNIWYTSEFEHKNSFDILSVLISTLKSTGISDKLGAFDKYSLSVTRTINKSLFKDGKDVIPFSTHTFIFVKETSEYLVPSVKEHMWGITAVMTNTNVSNTSTMMTEQIKNKILCRLKNFRPSEILFFSPASTFVYASPVWISELRKKGEKILRRRLYCMFNNYHSFFNMIFAVNRFLNDSFIRNKSKLPKNRCLEIINAFITAFPEIELNQKIYFKHAFEIADKIGFTSSLKSLRESEHE